MAIFDYKTGDFRDTFSEAGWRATPLAVEGRQVQPGLLGGGV